jgi:hypothetical protein
VSIGRASFAAACFVACTVLSGASARAEEPAFALSSGLVVRAGPVGGETQLGGALLFDVWYPRGPVRIGGTTGVIALFGQEERTRIFAPLLFSLAVETMGPKLGFSLRFRGGMWAGATDDGLKAGSMLGGGVFLHYRVEERISIALGVDTLFVFGHGDISLFVPSLSLVYRPGASPDEP